DPRFDPVDQKREQRIRIPPQWAFGVLYGGAVDGSTIKNDVERLLERDIPVDAYWIDDEWTNNLSQFMDQHEIRKGTHFSENSDTDSDFFLLPLDSDLDVVQQVYENTQNEGEKNHRGFIFSGIANIYDEEFKLYPVNRYSNNSSTGFDVLKDQVEKVSNPRLTMYEIPFLTHDLVDLQTVEESAREELFMRWIQFSAFNPIMTLFPAPNGLFAESGLDLSGRAVKNLKKYSVLRNELFPYIYSHAHFTRQSGEKMIQGDGLRNTQFMFGDAFLVAPIVERGVRERSVYFPDGYWYDYNSNNSYEGGRSWFIEAPLETIPVYVKAGSIVPYREFSPTIEEGDKGFLRVEIYTGDAGTFRLTEDDGFSEDYLEGIAARTMFRYNELEGRKILTIGAVQRHYHEMIVVRDYEIEFLYGEKPSKILINENTVSETEGEGITYWIYDDQKESIKLIISEANRDEKIDIEILP
ncbi:MAG: TIM-barrel domain-containing protein, partial [Balneolaceae bacterium]